MSPSEKTRSSEEKGPAARRRPKAAGEAYLLYVEPAGEGANEADGPLSSLEPFGEQQSGQSDQVRS